MINDNIIKYCEKCDNEVETKVITKTEEYEIVKEMISFDTQVRVCKCCNTSVFDEELDQKTLVKAFNIFRQKHHLLMPEQIKDIREMYGLSQRSFAKLLNWGDRTIYRYENGSLQDKAHNALLIFLKDPINMKNYILNNETGLEEKKLNDLKSRVDILVDSFKIHRISNSIVEMLSEDQKSIFNGFKVFDYEKFANVVIYFASKQEKLLKSKLVKLLFYSDFAFYKDYGVSITGSIYSHLPYGPAPKEHDLIFESMRLEKIININKFLNEECEFYEIAPIELVSEKAFEKEEINLLEKVYKNYGEVTELKEIEIDKDKESPYEYAKYLMV